MGEWEGAETHVSAINLTVERSFAGDASLGVTANFLKGVEDVLALYEIVNPGGLDPLGNWRCLEKQKNFVNQRQNDVMIPGGTCSFRWADARIISMGPATGNGKRAVGAKPTPNLVAGQPGVKVLPFEHHSGVTSYKDLHFNKDASDKAARFAVEKRKVAFTV